MEMTFDPRGSPSRLVFLKDSGEITSSIDFTVDERGNIVEVVQGSGDSPALPLSRQEQSALRRSDQLRYREFLGVGGVESRTVYRRDDEGRPIEETVYLGYDVLSTHATFVYNRRGDTIKEIRRTRGSDRVFEYRFDYDYDTHGNWTRRTASFEGGSHEILRTITYFDD